MRADFLGLPVTILDTDGIHTLVVSLTLHHLGTYVLDRCDFVSPASQSTLF